MVSSIKNGKNLTKYTYDNLGRIETIDNGKITKYYYDNLGQVIREDNGELNKTVIYTYDTGGNLLKGTEYALTSSETLGAATKTVDYSYGDSNWKDKLTAYNGKAITYDAIGNPLTYDGYTFKWGSGRTLGSITGNNKNISYKYNSEGIRTEKTVDGVNYKYTLAGSNVVYEEITNGNTKDKILYNYGDKGLVGFQLNDEELYFYVRNAQGDIIGIINSIGEQVVTYTYDTWGKLISITGDKVLGEKNPYRYRGYRYDNETGLYYLQSRYYNPEWGRFLNIDAIGGNIGALLSHNIYAYCTNNPINTSDPNGFRPIYTMGEETASMRQASYEAMNQHYTPKNYSNTSKFNYGESVIQGAISGGVDELGGWTAGLFIKGKKVWQDLDYLTMGKYVTKYSKGASAAMKGLGLVGSVGMTAWNAKQSFDKGETYGAAVDIVAGAIGIGIGAIIGALTTGAVAALGAAGLAAFGIGVLGFGLGIGVGVVIDLGANEIKNNHYGR